MVDESPHKRGQAWNQTTFLHGQDAATFSAAFWIHLGDGDDDEEDACAAGDAVARSPSRDVIIYESSRADLEWVLASVYQRMNSVFVKVMLSLSCSCD